MTSTDCFTAGTAPGAWPLVGHAWPMVRRPWDFLQSLSEHGDMVEIRLGPERVYAVCHPDLLHQVLTNDRTFDKGGIQVVGMLHAGSETTAMGLTWALYRLTRHPEVQRRLQAEADAVLGGRPAHFDDIPSLPYAGRVFTETLRIYPLAWAFTRTVTVRTELAGRTLEPGTTIVCCSLATHHYDGLYARPDDFEPDRWLPGRSDTPPRSALTSFGGGARRCVGDIYAMNEAVLTLATIAGRWRLDLSPGADVRLTPRTIGIYPRKLLIGLQPRRTGPRPAHDGVTTAGTGPTT